MRINVQIAGEKTVKEAEKAVSEKDAEKEGNSATGERNEFVTEKSGSNKTSSRCPTTSAAAARRNKKA